MGQQVPIREDAIAICAKKHTNCVCRDGGQLGKISYYHFYSQEASMAPPNKIEKTGIVSQDTYPLSTSQYTMRDLLGNRIISWNSYEMGNFTGKHVKITIEETP